jgi:hypothetical protein
MRGRLPECCAGLHRPLSGTVADAHSHLAPHSGAGEATQVRKFCCWFRVVFLTSACTIRFTEAISQCAALLTVLEQGSWEGGGVVALPSSVLAQSLSQQYFCGFALPVPLTSVLSKSDFFEIPASVPSGTGQLGANSGGIDFDTLLAHAAQASAVVRTECVRQDCAVSIAQWKRKVDKKREHLDFLLRKFGEE